MAHANGVERDAKVEIKKATRKTQQASADGHHRKADPTMVMIDAQTVKGGRAGTTFHEAGGRGGYTRGATGALCDQWLYATVPCVINATDFRGEL